MVDVVDKKTRSLMMAGIRSRNTKPERVIRALLHREGYRFRLHSPTVPGRPDIVLPKFRAAIHVHGCFWHGHDCGLYRLPGTRSEFWRKKIIQNRARDRRVIHESLHKKWRHLTVWECAFRGPGQIGLDRTVKKICRWILSRRKCSEVRSRRR